MKYKTRLFILGIFFVLISVFCHFSLNQSESKKEQNKPAVSSQNSTVCPNADSSSLNYKKDYHLESFSLVDESRFFTEQRPDRYDFLKNSFYDYLYNNDINIETAFILEDGFSFNDARVDFLIRYTIDGQDQYINCTYSSYTDSFDFYLSEGTPGRTNILKEAENNEQ